MPYGRRAVAAGIGGVAVFALLGIAGARHSPTTFSLTARRAQEVSATVRFLDAFNGGHLGAARALLSANVAISDCDFERARVQQFHAWPQQRAGFAAGSPTPTAL